MLTRQGYKQAIGPACLFKPLVARAFDNVMSLSRSVKGVNLMLMVPCPLIITLECKLPSVMKEDNYTVCCCCHLGNESGSALMLPVSVTLPEQVFSLTVKSDCVHHLQPFWQNFAN